MPDHSRPRPQPPRHRARRRAKKPTALTLAVLLMGSAAALTLGDGRASAAPGSKNVITSVQPVQSKGHPLAYEITLTSSDEFPMRDEVTTLSIGGRQFTVSHYLPGGSLNTIVFSITSDEFQSLKDGDPVIVYYGQDDAQIPDAQWIFGPFRKSTMGRPVSVVTDSPTAVRDNPVRQVSAVPEPLVRSRVIPNIPAPFAITPTDPGAIGPYPIASQDYNYGLAAYTPPDLKNATTGVLYPNELDGRVYYPRGLDDGTSLAPSGPMPLIVFLHGRHSAVYNTRTGATVGSVWPPAVTTGGDATAQIPSYQGYDYAANVLASWGYVVVSIGANGINAQDATTSDAGALARAELIQTNLDMWKVIATTGGPALVGNPYDPFGAKFAGKVDMTNIGTMGHSRGGEGVMAHYVYNGRQASPYAIKAVLPLAPVDFSRYVVNNVPIGVILPYCDGDVSDLQGIHFFDDARYNVPGDLTAKYFWTVMGADHNLFNTIWTPGYFVAGTADDWGGTPGGAVDPWAGPTVPGTHRLSPTQQQGVGLAYMTAFFRAYLGGETRFLPFLKGDAPAPPSAMTTELFETYQAPDTPTTRRDINRFLDASSLSTNALGGAVSGGGLSPFQLGGGGAYGSGRTASGAHTLDQFALPGQPAARQPSNTPSSLAYQAGGLRQLEIGWDSPSAFLENTIPVAARNFTPFSTLQFRAAVNFTDYRNSLAFEDFDVQLTDGSGNVAYTPVSAWSSALMYPPGRIVRLPKVILNAVRIPLSAFQGVNLNNIVSVRFAFDRQQRGSILLTDIALTD